MNITKKYNPLETFLMSTLFVFQKLNYLIPILLLIILSINSLFLSWIYPIIAIGGTYLMFQSHYDSKFKIKELDKNFILKKCFLAWFSFVASISIAVAAIVLLSFLIEIPPVLFITVLWIAVGISAITITNNNIELSYQELWKDTCENHLFKKDVIPLLTIAMFVGGIHSILFVIFKEQYFIKQYFIDTLFTSFVAVVYVHSVMSYYRINK
jgi:hypothetical protein